ncbi:hypothetical protein LCGC14_0558070 [marine sediment metagenome]|uniref:Uncharacterized protein n=1 Tax=marine sediment metagenome TaxID=412755 RepID=A0A0F9RT21_9ZZZZ
MEILYFALPLVYSGFFVWLMHTQYAQSTANYGIMLTELNRVHEVHQQQISAERTLANTEITRLVEVNIDLIKQTDTRSKLLKQLADQIQIECAQAVGHAAADAFGTYRERVFAGEVGTRATDEAGDQRSDDSPPAARSTVAHEGDDKGAADKRP